LSGYLIEECVYFNLSRNVEMNLLSLKIDEINEAGKATQVMAISVPILEKFTFLNMVEASIQVKPLNIIIT
jgi:hypothetical protein